MLILKSEYDFYRMTEPERIELTKSCFRLEGRRSGSIYFPLVLSVNQFNYGIQQGLILVSQIHPARNDYKKWFRVCAISPDDMDLDLDFNETETHLHQEVIAFVKAQDRTKPTYYKDFLQAVQAHFKAGEITSG